MRPSSKASLAEGGPDGACTLDERRRAALAQLDDATYSSFHAKVCMVAGAGFFTDAYDLFAINLAATMIGYVYGHETPGKPAKLNPNQDLGVKVAAPVGTLVGQMLFGWLADIVGRKRMYGLELIIVIIATFAQALSAGNHAVSIVGVLVVWRFIASFPQIPMMGVGIGGDYPLSATIASEDGGNFVSVLVSFIVTVAFKDKILHHDPDVNHLEHIDYMWRIVIGFGCVPGVIALYFRLTIPETPRFTMDIERNVLQAADDIKAVLTTGEFTYDPDTVYQRADAPRASSEDFKAYFGKWKNAKLLIGTCYSWFALDIAFYGLGLNTSSILSAMNFGTPPTSGNLGVYQNLHNVTVGNLIFSVAGLIPGYWVAFLFIDSWGRKPIQLWGFLMLTILFVIMGFCFDTLNATTAGRNAFVFLYCLTNFFQNFGPNTTTFVIPGEIFPTRYRATGHGLSAASGKFGAIVAQVGFSQLVNIGGTNAFVKHIMQILAFFMLTGVFSTLLLPETKQQSLEELSNENQDGFVRGPTTQIEIQVGIVVGRRVY
ncbi:Phosphate transporter [Mycena sanguinolenta]|uniref:Phosphate transporter n=1 Tax=Mycena sanguinolenta TaxID=230812 RepID=A0A8H6X603_9AGAR|nr:Phosphate transporter [Mycena sanguinolenta]